MALIMAMACAQEQEFEREFIDPAGGGTQVVTVSDHGVKTIYVGGQVGRGDDFAAHVDTAFQSVVRRLESAGASATDVVKIRIFVTDFDPAEYSIIREARLRTFNEDSWPTSTMVGIQSLWTVWSQIMVSGTVQRNGFPDENLPASALIGPESLYSDTALIEIEGVAVVQGGLEEQ